ncbi:MAG TPA: hypothetical protein VFM90_13405 [Cyclobacteriaceae bacterium]|nr:hypothetical protein [Cyclobacteriaceae bacterium]
MQKVLFLILLTVALPADDPKLVKVKISNEITAMLPKDFVPMGSLDFSQRYPSVRKPIGAYTNPEHEVDFSVNTSATSWPDANLEMAQKFFKSGVMNMFDRVEMIREGIHEVNGKKFIYLEFESRIKGDQSTLGNSEAILKYSYLQYWVEPSRTLVFSFNCPARLKTDWQETADKIMKSVKLK